MGRAWVPKAKEDQDVTICWKSDGHSILGRKRRYYVGLFTQETITGVYYANLLEPPSVKNAEVNSLKVFCCNITTRESTLAKLQWMLKSELIPHPANSPDLAHSDFFLFQNLKKDIHGLHFRSDEGVVTAVEEWVNGKDPDFFSSWLMALEHRWSKCITLEGNYIEKEEVDLNRK